MFLDRKPFVFLWRPLHESVVNNLLWPFLFRVKLLFFHETSGQLQDIGGELRRLAAEVNTSRQELSIQLETLRHEQRQQLQFIGAQIDSARSQQGALMGQLAYEIATLKAQADMLASRSGNDSATQEIRAGFAQIQARMDALQAAAGSGSEWQAIERLILCSLQEPARPHFAMFQDQLPAARLALERGKVE